MYNTSTKQTIYETAKLLFFEDGYKVGSRKIATEAGVNQGLITYYFKSKKNIALMLLRENFEIIAIHIKYFVDPQKDILLFMLTFIKIAMSSIITSPKYARFIQQISEENLLEESIRFGNNQTEYYEKLVKDLMPPNGKSLEKNLSIFLATVYGIQRNLAIRFDEAIAISFEEQFDLLLRSFIWGLRLEYSEEQILALQHKVENLSDAIFATHPDLKHPENYLFQEKKIISQI